MSVKKLRNSLHAWAQGLIVGNKTTEKEKPPSLERVSLLDLPGEIRNEIYGYCMTEPTEPGTLYWCNRVLPPVSALSRVSKLVREEYLSYFDGQGFDREQIQHVKLGIVNHDFESAMTFIGKMATKRGKADPLHDISITLIFTIAFKPMATRQRFGTLMKVHTEHVFPRLKRSDQGDMGSFTISVFDYRKFRRTRLWCLVVYQNDPSAFWTLEGLLLALLLTMVMPIQVRIKVLKGRAC